MLGGYNHICKREYEADQHRASSIACLPFDVLINVFSRLGPLSHREVLPLVCKQWRDALRQASPVWQIVELDFVEECRRMAIDAKKPVLNYQVRRQEICRWLRTRASSVQHLSVKNTAAIKVLADLLQNWQSHDFTRDEFAQLLGMVRGSLQQLVVENVSELLGPRFFNTIASFTSLKVLVLRGVRVKFTGDQARSLARMHQLEELVVDCDQPPQSDATATTNLELYQWGLPCFPTDIVYAKNLSALTLSCHYRITAIPETISCLVNLEMLALDFCSLKTVPASVSALSALVSLDLEGNIFLGDRSWNMLPLQTRFPRSLSRLASLRFLNLSSCGLRAVPDVVTTLTGLRTLELENNLFGLEMSLSLSFPSGLSRLSKLDCLNLAACRMSYIPPVILTLTSLETLDLTANRIQDAGIPDALSKLANLKEIGLKNNNLSRVPRVLGECKKLEEIYLENNCNLEVTGPLDFIANLPALEVVMIGKQGGQWSNTSVHFICDFFFKVVQRNPEKELVRINYVPGKPKST